MSNAPFERVPQPLAYAGCYSLHLYCDRHNFDHGWDEFPHQYDSYEKGTEARSAARRDGWVIHKDRTATCPKCSSRPTRTS